RFSTTQSLPPPTSTLFPYTTLFRSCTVRVSDIKHHIRIGNWVIIRIYDCSGELVVVHSVGNSVIFRNCQVGQIVVNRTCNERSRDRKSTRLNSSHVKISYAVFCLKK